MPLCSQLDAVPRPERASFPLAPPVDFQERNTRIVGALEKRIAILEREQDEKVALWDELERQAFYELDCLSDEILANGVQLRRFRKLVHERQSKLALELQSEGWADA